MPNRDLEHPVVKRRIVIYFIALAAGLLLVALTTTKYHGGFSLAGFAWAFPAGVIQCFQTRTSLDGPLAAGYAIYFVLLVSLCLVKSASRVGVILGVHILVVILTVRGCHSVVGQLPH